MNEAGPARGGEEADTVRFSKASGADILPRCPLYP